MGQTDYKKIKGRTNASGDITLLKWAQKHPTKFYEQLAKMAPKQEAVAAKTSEDFTKLLNSCDEEAMISVEGKVFNLQRFLDNLKFPEDMVSQEAKDEDVKWKLIIGI